MKVDYEVLSPLDLIGELNKFMSDVLTEINNDMTLMKPSINTCLKETKGMYTTVASNIKGYSRSTDAMCKLLAKRKRDFAKGITNPEIQKTEEMLNLRVDWFYFNYIILEPCLIY